VVQDLMIDVNYRKVSKLAAWAKDHGRGVNELAQAWLLAQPRVCSVITGARSPQQFNSNVTAAGWNLTGDQLTEIEAILNSERAHSEID
jgi:aryl-alcohol dehydrogenase-like predicted oxidoreductase